MSDDMGKAVFLASLPPIAFGQEFVYNWRVHKRCDMPKTVLDITKVDTSDWHSKTSVQIASELGVSRRVVDYWRKKLSISACRVPKYQDGLRRCCTCKQYLPLEKFGYYKKHSSDGLRPDCLDCRREARRRNRDRINARKRILYANNPEPIRERNREYRNRPEVKESMAIYMRKRHSTYKAEYVEMAGGKCQRCGYNEFTSGLDFHHVNGDEKADKPAGVISSGNRVRALSELDKCALLCRNCHQSFHGNDWTAEFVKRDGLGWTIKQPF